MIEYVDHLHEHFVDPVRYETAATWRRSARVLRGDRPESLAEFELPGGAAWRS